MPQTGALGLLATLATMEVAVPKGVEPSRTQLKFGLNMLANERGSYKEPQVGPGTALTWNTTSDQGNSIEIEEPSYLK